MPAKLVSIGDSLTQGFQSGSISRTKLSYPVMIAECLGAVPFKVPDFSGEGGLPVNLEQLFRQLAAKAGRDLNWYELPQAYLSLRNFLDEVEDYWERGPGSGPSSTGPLHDNLAVWGFELGDCNRLTEAICSQVIPSPQDDLRARKQLTEFAMYRTARRTLNPRFEPQYAKLTQLEIAAHIAEAQKGIENLIFFLGANNCLGTVTDLAIQWSEAADLGRLAHERTCNLWRPEHFQVLLNQVAEQLQALKAQHVFVSTIPHVTVPPVTRGITPGASSTEALSEDGYFEYYTHFWVWDEDFARNPQDYEYLTRDQARLIDQTVDAYNAMIKTAAANRGWHVVDLAQKLDQLAYRRQQGTPQYEFPQGLIAAMQANPATRYRFNAQGRPILDTRYLRVDLSKTTAEERYKGGIISLDGIHPTTIGYGLVAHEFLEVMGQVVETKPLDWTTIVEADTLVKDPPQNLESLQSLLGFIASQEPLIRLIKVIGQGF